MTPVYQATHHGTCLATRCRQERSYCSAWSRHAATDSGRQALSWEPRDCVRRTRRSSIELGTESAQPSLTEAMCLNLLASKLFAWYRIQKCSESVLA